MITMVMLLVVMQATPPLPRKASDSPADSKRNVNHDTARQKDISAPTPVQDSPRGGNQEESRQSQSSNYEQPPVRVLALPKRDWADWVTWGSSIALVIVGILGVGAAVWTLRLIKRQTEATEIAANAAKASADAFVGLEQARIVVTVEPIFPSRLNLHELKEVKVTAVIKNYGKSPAWITGMTAKLNIFGPPDLPRDSAERGPTLYGRLPDVPQYGDISMRDGPSILTPSVSFTLSLTLGRGDFERIRNGDAVLLVYGIVKYRDVFRKDQEPIKFCFVYDHYTREGAFSIGGPEAYNSQ